MKMLKTGAYRLYKKRWGVQIAVLLAVSAASNSNIQFFKLSKGYVNYTAGDLFLL